MKKNTTLLLGGLLGAAAAIVGLGSGLRAVDYLIAASDSRFVQATAKLLLNPIAAAVILLLAITLIVKAFRMPSEKNSESGRSRSPEPNIVVLSTHVLPIDRNLQLSGPETGARAAVVRFRNAADPKGDVGVMLGTRATIEISANTRQAHATGLWTDERSPYADFGVGDIHDLIVAVRINNETSVPDVVANDLRMWNISQARAVDVKVQLVGGLERTIARDFSFTLELDPEFRLRKR